MILNLYIILNAMFLVLISSNDQNIESKIPMNSSMLAIGEIHRLEINNKIELELINQFISENGTDIFIFIEYPPSLYFYIDSFIRSNDSSFLKSYFNNWSNNTFTDFHQRQFDFIVKLINLKNKYTNIQLVCIDNELNRRNTYYVLEQTFKNIGKGNLFKTLSNNISYKKFLDSDKKEKLTLTLVENIKEYNHINNNLISEIIHATKPGSDYMKRDSFMYNNIISHLESNSKKSIFIAGAAHIRKTVEKNSIKSVYSTIYQLMNSKYIQKNKYTILTTAINSKYIVDFNSKKNLNNYIYPYRKIQKEIIDKISINNSTIINSNTLFNDINSHFDYLIMVNSSNILN